MGDHRKYYILINLNLQPSSLAGHPDGAKRHCFPKGPPIFPPYCAGAKKECGAGRGERKYVEREEREENEGKRERKTQKERDTHTQR